MLGQEQLRTLVAYAGALEPAGLICLCPLLKILGCKLSNYTEQGPLLSSIPFRISSSDYVNLT